MVILSRTSVDLLLLAIFVMPCATTLYRHNRQNVFEPPHQVEEESNRAQRSSSSKNYYYSKQLRLWNESWPMVVKQKHELITKYGSAATADQPYTLSQSCFDDLQLLVYGLSVLDDWALEMVDASGKIPSGVLLGNKHWIGTYGECVGISSEGSQAEQLDNSTTTVLGTHCLVNIGVTSSTDLERLGINFGVCVPRNCSSTDVVALFNLVLSEVTAVINATAADCKDDSPLPLDSGAIFVIVILCALGALNLLGTCLDLISNYWNQPVVAEDDVNENSEYLLLLDGAQRMDPGQLGIQTDKGSLYHFLMAFSVLANAKKILHVEPKQINNNLGVLHGIRVFSIMWIILSHTHLLATMKTSNIRDYFKMSQRFSFQAVLNSSVSVDTFFVLSATLASYLLLKEIRARGGPSNIDWTKLILHRFWRLTPLYMLVLAMWTTLFKYIGGGPYWLNKSDKLCKKYWWANLLYINNVVHRDSLCMTWSWYLSNDMQFFVLLPIFVALLYKWPLFGGIVTSVFMLASAITTGVITQVNNYPPAMIQLWRNFTVQDSIFTDVYMVPWCRINPYLIGILLGYILYKSDCKLRINRAVVVLGWCLAAACNLSVLYGLYNVANGHQMSPSFSALYASVHRTAWGVGVAWVILACATGHGGFVNEFLSLPILLPLSRLTYAAYLVHPVVIYWYYGSLKVPIFADDARLIYMFLGHLVMSFASGFVMSTLAESPIMSLERSFRSNRND